jgi:hypothetical protein
MNVESLEERGSGGGEKFLLDAGGIDGRAAEKLGGGGRGNGQDSVSALDGASADVEGGAVPAAGGDVLDGYGSADDIDDGIFGANFMKMDGFGRAIVNFGLGLGEKLEGFEGKSLGGGADGRAGDDFADLRQAAMGVRGVLVLVRVGLVMLVGMRVGVSVGVLVVMLLRRRFEVDGLVGASVDEDIDLGGCDSAALDAMKSELGVESEGAGDGLELLQGDTGVYGGAEEHVATDSGETIEVGNAHCESERELARSSNI